MKIYQINENVYNIGWVRIFFEILFLWIAIFGIIENVIGVKDDSAFTFEIECKQFPEYATMVQRIAQKSSKNS